MGNSIEVKKADNGYIVRIFKESAGSDIYGKSEETVHETVNSVKDVLDKWLSENPTAAAKSA